MLQLNKILKKTIPLQTLHFQTVIIKMECLVAVTFTIPILNSKCSINRCSNNRISHSLEKLRKILTLMKMVNVHWIRNGMLILLTSHKKYKVWMRLSINIMNLAYLWKYNLRKVALEKMCQALLCNLQSDAIEVLEANKSLIKA